MTARRAGAAHTITGWAGSARRSELGCGVQAGATRAGQSQDGHRQLRDPTAAREQPGRSRSGSQRCLGPTGDAASLSTSHPNDFKCMEFFRQRGLEILQAAGARSVWADPVAEARGGAHSRGTCRMGNDSKTSVVDARYHRAHDVPNLFIVDGSSLRHRWAQPPHA